MFCCFCPHYSNSGFIFHFFLLLFKYRNLCLNRLPRIQVMVVCLHPHQNRDINARKEESLKWFEIHARKRLENSLSLVLSHTNITTPSSTLICSDVFFFLLLILTHFPSLIFTSPSPRYFHLIYLHSYPEIHFHKQKSLQWLTNGPFLSVFFSFRSCKMVCVDTTNDIRLSGSPIEFRRQKNKLYRQRICKPRRKMNLKNERVELNFFFLQFFTRINKMKSNK